MDEMQELKDQVRQLREQQAHQSEALYALAKINRGYGTDQVIQDLLSHTNALNPGEYVFPPKGSPVQTKDVFGVWNGASFKAEYDTYGQVFDAVRELSEPYPERSLEFYPKAGEGGSWIYRGLHPTWGDPSHLAIDGPEKIDGMKRIGDVYGVKVVPYYVIRGRDEWKQAEYENIRDIAGITGRVILNLETGPEYWNGPTDVLGVSAWWNELRKVVGYEAVIEVACIPRQSVANALGGTRVFREWIKNADRFSWECYDGVANDLGPGALKWVEDTFDPGPSKLIPIVQRNRIRTWIETFKLGTPEIQVWYLDGNW